MSKYGIFMVYRLMDSGEKQVFIILMGSVARNDYYSDSDIDICRIDFKKTIERKEHWPNGPINYIDYEIETFHHLYSKGSLFVYHILKEGILLEGDKKVWDKYKFNFKLKQDFNDELNNIIETMCIFNDINFFGGKYLSLYSNLYTMIKNFSIFYLANNNKYIFNKEKAMNKTFGLSHNQILVDSYNYFERGIANDKWNYSCKVTACNVLNFYFHKIKEL